MKRQPFTVRLSGDLVRKLDARRKRWSDKIGGRPVSRSWFVEMALLHYFRYKPRHHDPS